jgi:hypothetical protein
MFNQTGKQQEAEQALLAHRILNESIKAHKPAEASLDQLPQTILSTSKAS